jgi:hypothetical protein
MSTLAPYCRRLFTILMLPFSAASINDLQIVLEGLVAGTSAGNGRHVTQA